MPDAAPPGERTLMGFDHGSRKIGVAIGQEITATGCPLTSLRNRNSQPDWDAIQGLIRQWRPHRLVVGLPYNLDGSESQQTRLALRFSRRLHGRTGLPVDTMDERLSSEAARAEITQLRRSGMRKDQGRTNLDAVAAALILENWMLEPHP